MLSNKTLNSLDLSSKDEYFDYAVQTYHNGQFTQLKDLIKKMSSANKREFLDYLNNSGESHNTQDTIAKYLF